MAILKHVAPASAFKVGLVVYGIVGLVLGALCSAVSLAGLSFAAHGHMPFAGRIGMFAILVCPIVYGILGAVGAVIGAVIYNLASDWVGGLEVELG